MIEKIKDYFEQKQQTIPNVAHYVFGSDEQSLREQVAKLGSYYMFVDYGGFSSDVDKNNRIADSFECAVTIAMPVGASIVSYDDILTYQIATFNMISELRKAMLADQRGVAVLQYLSPKHQISPFVAPDMCRSIGHTLYFKLEGLDMLGAK